jgi:hypothetical protein
MGFNKRKMEDQRRKVARRKRLHAVRPKSKSLRMPTTWFAVWNERQAKRMPMLFSPTIRRGHHGRLLVPASALQRDWIGVVKFQLGVTLPSD